MKAPLACLALALVARIALAHPAPPPPPPASALPAGTTFEGAIEVRVVNVDVVVSDRDGKPVSGLRQEDFQLFEDGARVDVTNFEAVEEEAAAPPPAQTATAPAVTTGPAPRPPAQPLSLVLLVDNANLRPFGRNRVLHQVEELLAQLLRPMDRVMVVNHDLGLQVRRPFSETTRPLAEDLKAVQKGICRGQLADIDRRTTMSQLRELGCTPEAAAIKDDYVRRMHADVENTLAILQHFVDSLAGLPGKKALLYVSDGFPLSPGEDMAALYNQVCGSDKGGGLEVEDVSLDLRRLTNAANAGRVTFYSLEAAGLRGFTSASAEDSTALMSPVQDFMANANVQDSLANLASETGGRALLNGNDLRRDLAAIGRDLRTYYSLGFSPRHPDDRKVHPLEVKVLRPGLKARMRTNYRANDAAGRRLADLEALLWYGNDASPNPLGVRVQSGVPAAGEKGRLLVPLTLMIPLRSVTLIPNGARSTGRLSLALTSHDAEGRTAPVRQLEIPLDVATTLVEKAGKTVLRHEIKLLLRPGSFVFALSLHDEVGGETSLLHYDLLVEKPSKVKVAAAGAKPRG